MPRFDVVSTARAVYDGKERGLRGVDMAVGSPARRDGGATGRGLSFLYLFVEMVFTMIGMTVAFSLEYSNPSLFEDLFGFNPRIALGIIFGGIGYLVGATIAYEFQRFLDWLTASIKLREIWWAMAGIVIGMVVANLFIFPVIVLLYLNHELVKALTQRYVVLKAVLPAVFILLPTFLNFMLAYFGAVVFLRKKDELGTIFSSEASGFGRTKVLDTNMLVDGRVADLVASGILEGTLVVPRFVLHELQLLADSTDPSKRRMGKRGFEVLEELRERFPSRVVVDDTDYPELKDVDSKLLRYAAENEAIVMSNDFSVKKLAAMEGLRVINLNDVSDALHPLILTGDKLELKIVKKGKEADQGVGYLNDGTMVVVKGGAEHIGESVVVEVTSIQQSSVGRMIFSVVVD